MTGWCKAPVAEVEAEATHRWEEWRLRLHMSAPRLKLTRASLLLSGAWRTSAALDAVVEAEDAMCWAPRLKPKGRCISFLALKGVGQNEEVSEHKYQLQGSIQM